MMVMNFFHYTPGINNKGCGTQYISSVDLRDLRWPNETLTEGFLAHVDFVLPSTLAYTFDFEKSKVYNFF